jgi:nucleotide-binding universal stress UspA family protein
MAVQIPPTGRILVGTDGSPASVAAVRWAGREAELRGMRVHVVYVRDMRRPAPAPYAPQPRAAEGTGPAAGESALRRVVREAFGAQSEGVQMELADGPPARVLLERSVGAEMLVLGSARHGGGPGAPAMQAKAALGPVARDCLHAAPCPVVVVRSSDVRLPAEPAHA